MEGEIGEVQGGHMLRVLWVPAMEFIYDPFRPLNIFHWSPFILFDTVSLPVHQVFEFSSEHLAVYNMFNFRFFDSIVYYQWGWSLLDVFSNGIHIIWPQQSD